MLSSKIKKKYCLGNCMLKFLFLCRICWICLKICWKCKMNLLHSVFKPLSLVFAVWVCLLHILQLPELAPAILVEKGHPLEPQTCYHYCNNNVSLIHNNIKLYTSWPWSQNVHKVNWNLCAVSYQPPVQLVYTHL